MSSKVPEKIISRLPPLPSVKEILRLYNVHSLKSLGQNFLLDPKLTTKFVTRSGKIKDSYVCEVGPGPGNITRNIINFHPKKVIVVEKDHRFLPALSLLQEACKGKVSVVLGDILNFEMGKLFPNECERPWDGECPPINIIGNLPFNVSLPLIIKWLHAVSEQRSAWRYGRVGMTLTVQKEVAERMAAPVGHFQRSRLSVMCQNWCEVTHSFTIPGKVFVPEPMVDVGVVTMVPRITPQVKGAEFKRFEKLVRLLFSQRNKKPSQSLARLFPDSVREELIVKMITTADVDPGLMSGDLPFHEIANLYHAYSQIIDDNPQYARYNQGDRSFGKIGPQLL